MKKSIVIVLFLYFFASLTSHAKTLGVYKTETGVGWVEKTEQGDIILHLEGSYYDMGRQHAALLKDDAAITVRAAIHSIRIQYPLIPPKLAISAIHRYVSQKQDPYIPAGFKDEMRGLADESGISLKYVEALHSATFLTSCSGSAAWGTATKDGELYFMRSNDVAATIDPKTKTAIQDKGMIVIYKPKGEIPYMMISWPGYIGASDGMNAEGVAVGNMSLPSKYETPSGLPMPFRMKQTLAKARTLEEAIDWMTRKPLAGGYNFLVADAGIPDAVAIEMDARTFYVGGWDGPAESNSYDFKGRHYEYTPAEDLITRTNHPLSSELIAHRKMKIDDGKPHSKRTAQRYMDLRARLVGELGDLNMVSMLDILREHYNSINWEKGPTLGVTSHQFCMAPKSGDFLVSFSKGNPMKLGRPKAGAFNQEYHQYNFFDLLDNKPDME